MSWSCTAQYANILVWICVDTDELELLTKKSVTDSYSTVGQINLYQAFFGSGYPYRCHCSVTFSHKAAD